VEEAMRESLAELRLGVRALSALAEKRLQMAE
jgi:hypothetical protein